MKNKKLLFIIWGILFFQTRAQSLGIDIQESQIYKMTTARVQNDYILPDNKGGFITISTKRSGFLANPMIFESYATHYNNRLEKLKEKTFKLNKGSIKGAIKGAFVKDNFLNLINLESNFRKKYYAFKRIKANIETKEVNEEEFFRINKVYSKNDVNLFVNLNSLYYEKLKYYSDVNYYNPKIFIKFSKNNRFFTIVYRDFDEKQTKYFVNVFDQDFQKVFSKSFAIPKSPKLVFINNLDIDDNNGNVYIATKIYNSDPFLRRRFINTSNVDKFSIYKMSAAGYKKYDLKTSKVIEDIELITNGKLTLVGFYRNNFIDLNDIDGLMRIDLDKTTMQEIHKSFKSFKNKLVSIKFKTKKKRSKNHKMIIREVFDLGNGGLLINAEDFYVPLMNKKKDREQVVSEIVGDIFVIRVTGSGNIAWSTKIYKQQRVKPRLALHSFLPVLHYQSNYIIFTDSKTKKQSGKEAFYLQGKDLQNLNGVRISMSGSTQHQIIKENKRSKFRFMPIEGTKISPNEVIIPAKDHHLIKFYKLTFK